MFMQTFDLQIEDEVHFELEHAPGVRYIKSMAGEVKCFFYSEFDPVAGPKISCQV